METIIFYLILKFNLSYIQLNVSKYEFSSNGNQSKTYF